MGLRLCIERGRTCAWTWTQPHSEVQVIELRGQGISSQAGGAVLRADTYTYVDSHADAHAYINRDIHTDGDIYAHIDMYADGYTYEHIHTNVNIHADGYPHCHSYGDEHTHVHAYVYTD